MAQNYIFSGERLDWTNDSNADVVSGQAVMIGSLPGVALVDIAEDETGAVAMCGVWELPLKEGVAIPDVGAPLYLVAGTLSDLPADGPLYGNCFSATASADGLVHCLIGGYGEAQEAAIADLAASNYTAIAADYADLAAARASVNTLKGEIVTRDAAITTKVNAIITALENVGLIAS